MHHNADKMILVGETYTPKVEVGSKLRFEGEKQMFTVQASNRVYSVCTKPLNMIRRRGGGKYEHEKTVLYTIVDWRNGIRGTENLVFGFGAETKEQCEEMLERITNAGSDISHRNWTDLKVEKAILV